MLAIVLVSVFFLGHLLLAAGEHQRAEPLRLRRAGNVVDTPSGAEDCEGFETTKECVDAGRVEAREIRSLFYQQGRTLMAHRPVLGYGVGHFGGIVAETNDPTGS